MRYPYTLEPDGADYLVRFPGVPEALTGVTDPEAERGEIADCLITALAAYAAEGAPLPAPAHVTGAEAAGVIDVPVLIQAKLALIRAMAEDDIGLRALARRLAFDPKQAARLVDLDHNSRIGDIERALAALGRKVELHASAA